MRHATITGWGKCVPPAVLTNSDLEAVTDTSDDWIVTRTGIKERRISHVDNSMRASVAAQRALAAAGRTADEVDLLVTATCTPDRTVPPMSVVVQDNIGAQPAGAFDLNATCSGFIYALSTIDKIVRSGGAEVAVVIGSEKLSYWLDFTDRTTAVLFGDGAGAVVVEPSDEPGGMLSYEMGADGSLADILCVANTGTQGLVGNTELPRLSMDGPEVFRRAVKTMGDASVRVVEKAGLTLGDVDVLIPHQANSRIIDATARRLKLDPAQVFVNIQSYGNTSAATIPIALTEALDTGRITPGAHVVFAAFGGGLTWAAGVYRWGDRVVPKGESDAELPPNDLSALELLQPNLDNFGLGVST
jgi:3-oxoacyl-[acyl-carrier-protein] synthase-3